MLTSPWQYFVPESVPLQHVSTSVPAMGNITEQIMQDETASVEDTVREVEVMIYTAMTSRIATADQRPTESTRPFQPARTPLGAGIIEPRAPNDNAPTAPVPHLMGRDGLAAIGVPPDQVTFGTIIRGIQNLPRAPNGMVWAPCEEHWWNGIPDTEADFMLCKLHDFQYELLNHAL